MADIAAAFQNEMGDLAIVFRTYMTEWTDLRISREWPDFCAATRDILDTLRVRILHENQTLYPAAQKILGLKQPVLIGALPSPTDALDGRTAA